MTHASKSDKHLGLGLYIAGQIAKAHGGNLKLVTSNLKGRSSPRGYRDSRPSPNCRTGEIDSELALAHGTV